MSISRVCKTIKSVVYKYATRSCANLKDTQLIEFHGKWPVKEKQDFLNDMQILSNFISEGEEQELMEEIEPYMSRLHYENDHWDDAIHGYRETERKKWYPNNRAVLERVSQVAFNDTVMPYVHVLDLMAEGVIKPHVDSARYCGDTIAGLSLLSDAVMRLKRTDDQKYNEAQTNNTITSDKNGSYRNQSLVVLGEKFYADIWLRRRSLYIMSQTSRYNFTHEVLGNEIATFKGRPIKKTRRVSIICRNEPV